MKTQGEQVDCMARSGLYHSRPASITSLCVCVYVCKQKNSNFPYLPTQNGRSNFCKILHNNSTPRRNDRLHLQGVEFSIIACDYS